MRQTTLFDYLPKIEKVKVENLKYEESPREQEISSNLILKQYKPLAKSLVQQDLTEIIKINDNFETLSDLLGENWFYDEESFGYTDKTHIVSISPTKQFNFTFFKLYRKIDFELIKNLQMDIEDLIREEYIIISDIEYSAIYLKIAIEILGKSVQVFQHKRLKLLYLNRNKFSALLCPKF